MEALLFLELPSSPFKSPPHPNFDESSDFRKGSGGSVFNLSPFFPRWKEYRLEGLVLFGRYFSTFSASLLLLLSSSSIPGRSTDWVKGLLETLYASPLRAVRLTSHTCVSSRFLPLTSFPSVPCKFFAGPAIVTAFLPSPLSFCLSCRRFIWAQGSFAVPLQWSYPRFQTT